MQKLLVRAEAIKDMFSAEQLERIVYCSDTYITTSNKEEKEAMYDVVFYTIEIVEEEFAIDKAYIKALFRDI